MNAEYGFHNIDTLPTGFLLNNQYKIERTIGRGGFGVTYSAIDTRARKRIAIKELYPQRFAARNPKTMRLYPLDGYGEIFQEYQHKFRKEAELIASLRHIEEVISIYHLFQENGTQYYAMEYLEGENLKEYMLRNGKMQWNQMTVILQDVLRTLVVLHNRGIIHRDIKPDNIFLSSSGKIHLIDYGSARSFVNTEGFTEMVTPGYAPPEQSKRYTKQQPCADIYAICATIYYCLSGKVPNPSEERFVMQKQMNTDPLRPLSMVEVTVPKYVSDAVRRGMCIDTKERFQNVQGLAEALHIRLPVDNTTGGNTGKKRIISVKKPQKKVKKHLICINGLMNGVSKELLFDSSITIGRLPNCTIRYPADAGNYGVSRIQCIVYCDRKGNVWIRDEQSSFGVFLDGKKIEKGKWIPAAVNATIAFGQEKYMIKI